MTFYIPVLIPGGLAQVDFSAITTPTRFEELPPEPNQVVWKNIFTVSTRNVLLRGVAFHLGGNIERYDIRNFRLFVDGQLVGKPVEFANDQRIIVFNNLDKLIASGARVMEVKADIVAGFFNKFTVSINQASDIFIMDSALLLPIICTCDSEEFKPLKIGVQIIKGASLDEVIKRLE